MVDPEYVAEPPCQLCCHSSTGGELLENMYNQICPCKIFRGFVVEVRG